MNLGLGIYPVTGIDLFKPRIQRCARFAVKDYNRKSKANLSLVRIKEAAAEVDEIIYFLLLAVEDKDSGWVKYFKTAVVLQESISYIKSVGLEEEEEYLVPISTSAFPPLPPIIQVEPEAESAAKFAVHSFNMKKGYQLEFDRVLQICSQGSDGEHSIYTMTLLVHDDDGYYVFKTTVSVPMHQQDCRMESTGFRFMCQVDPSNLLEDAPSLDKPVWVSADLLEKSETLYTEKSVSEHIKHLRKMVASNLTPHKVKINLLPALKDNIDLVTFSDFIASLAVLQLVISHLSSAQDAKLLLTHIERLCNVQQPTVRKQAARLLSRIKTVIASFQKLPKPERYSSLLEAAFVNSVQHAKFLLENGADPNVPEFGTLPLIYAAEYGKADMVQCLLEAGANANVTNQEGLTPIEVAAVRRHANHVEVMKLLFPHTSPISSYRHWTVSGIVNHMHPVQQRLKERSAGWQLKGEFAFRAKKYMTAAICYTNAMSEEDPSNLAPLLRRRCICWQHLSDEEPAKKVEFAAKILSDAKAISGLMPTDSTV